MKTKTKTKNEHENQTTATATTHMTHPTIGNNNQQFLEAVHLMAPGNKFIHSAARHVPQDILPAIAGVAALEFASTLDLLCKSWRLRRPLELRRRSRRRSCHSRSGGPRPNSDS